MKNNLIFQYLILDSNVNTRPKVNGLSRKQLYSKTGDISRRSFEKYAELVGADYQFATDRYVSKDHDNYRAYFFEVLRIIYDPQFEQYDDILFTDCDVVANTNENIFDLFDGEVAAVLESDHNKNTNFKRFNSKHFLNKDFCCIADKYKAFDAPIVPTLPPNVPHKLININTGVMVWSKEARLKARKTFDSWVEWLFHSPTEPLWLKLDQYFISAMLVKYDFDMQFLDTTWNDSPFTPEYPIFDSNFIHYTGGDWKLLMLEHHEQNKFKILQ